MRCFGMRRMLYVLLKLTQYNTIRRLIRNDYRNVPMRTTITSTKQKNVKLQETDTDTTARARER